MHIPELRHLMGKQLAATASAQVTSFVAQVDKISLLKNRPKCDPTVFSSKLMLNLYVPTVKKQPNYICELLL
jgi:hypothetical protein